MRRSIAKTLTASFALLWVMSVGLGVFSLQRMRAIHGGFEDVVEQRGKTVQLANQAAELHLENAKLTMQRILVDVLADPEGPGRLTAEMAGHSKSITALMEQIEQRSTLPKEKELFAAIKELRVPYLASRARAAKLFEDKKPKEAMAAVSVMMADLAKYRGAWGAFVRHQEELTAAAVVEGKAAYASARATSIVVLAISALLAAALAGLTVRAIRRSLASVIATAERIGRGDLQSVTAEHSFTEIDRLAEAMGRMTQLLARTIGELRAGVYGIDAAAREVASASDGLAQGTHEQAASVVQTTARLREIHASITSSTEKNRETEQRALEGAKNAVDCESAVDQTLRAMRAIADKIAIVEEIAERTNLLALNAAVEAAHAGHHGRGFAEVANAVRALSESSSAAAKEIRKLAGSSVDLAERSRALLGHLLPSIETTATLVQGVATAARDQAAGIDEIRTAMDQVDGVTQHHASAAEQLSSTSESLASQAATIRGLIAFFQVQARPA